MCINSYEAIWTGGYPNLCDGEWELYANGVRLRIEFPWGEHEDAGTWGYYRTWDPEPDEIESFLYAYRGLGCHDWIEQHQSWLERYFPREDWGSVFRAFQKSDFRRCCGGCI